MPAITEAGAIKRVRIEAVDVVRGVIMILMALDHVRDFFGNSSGSPTDLTQATVALFFTRWITYFCAPVFFLLTGTGAYLSLRKKSKRELSRFLFTRGLWLIFLELVVTRGFGLQFNFDYRVTMLIVLWALGWAMIVLSVLVYLPNWLVTTFGLAMIATHNLFDSVQSSNPIWSILHSPNFIVNNPQHVVFVAYPLIPWVGVTAAGYGTDLQLAVGTPPSVLVAPGCCVDCSLLHFAWHQYLRRPAALGYAEVSCIYSALISEYHEVSAIVALSADDAWPRITLLVGG
jgi:uncharacterized membrane protein